MPNKPWAAVLQVRELTAPSEEEEEEEEEVGGGGREEEEEEGLLPHSQLLATSHYPWPDRSCT